MRRETTAYGAAITADLYSKSPEYVRADLEERCAPVVGEIVGKALPSIQEAIVKELAGNMPLRVQYVEAGKTVEDLERSMELQYEYDVIHSDCDMIKIKAIVSVSFETEVVKRKRE